MLRGERGAPHEVAEARPQEVANTAWSFATLSAQWREAGIWDAVAAAALASGLRGYCAQNVANLAWAFAKASRRHGPLLAAVAAWAAPELGRFKPQELGNLAWAVATLAVRVGVLQAAIAQEAASRVDSLNPQGRLPSSAQGCLPQPLVST